MAYPHPLPAPLPAEQTRERNTCFLLAGRTLVSIYHKLGRPAASKSDYLFQARRYLAAFRHLLEFLQAKGLTSTPVHRSKCIPSMQMPCTEDYVAAFCKDSRTPWRIRDDIYIRSRVSELRMTLEPEAVD